MRKLGMIIGNTATVLLSVILLVSITGLQMRYHHCDTSGNTEHLFSLAFIGDHFTVEDFHCHCVSSNSETAHCENCNIDNYNHNHDQNSTGDCCESGNELFKLDLEYIVKSVSKVETPKALELFSVSSVLIFDNLTDQFESNTTFEIDPPPIPILFGKQFIISSNQLKIPSA